VNRVLAVRLAGVAIILGCVLLYRDHPDPVLRDLVLPAAIAVGALLAVRNVIAVALGAGLLAAIHWHPDGNWIERIVYPLAALVAFAIVATIWIRRFRERIATTHDARWRGRRTPPGG
jgi:hypothetical protein